MTINQLFTLAGWIRYDTDHWRVLDEPPTGEVDGLPQLRGSILATNGIMALLKLSGAPRPVYDDGVVVHFSQYIEIHLANFHADQMEGFEELVGAKTTKPKKPKLQVNYDEIV